MDSPTAHLLMVGADVVLTKVVFYWPQGAASSSQMQNNGSRTLPVNSTQIQTLSALSDAWSQYDPIWAQHSGNMTLVMHRLVAHWAPSIPVSTSTVNIIGRKLLVDGVDLYGTLQSLNKRLERTNPQQAFSTRVWTDGPYGWPPAYTYVGDDDNFVCYAGEMVVTELLFMGKVLQKYYLNIDNVSAARMPVSYSLAGNNLPSLNLSYDPQVRSSCNLFCTFMKSLSVVSLRAEHRLFQVERVVWSLVSHFTFLVLTSI